MLESLACRIKNAKDRCFGNTVFARQFALMMSSTVFSQVLVLGSSPLLTRLYTPENFGLFGLTLAYSSILSIMATGRYELAIMLPEDEDKAVHVVVLACIIATVSSTFFSLLAVVLGVAALPTQEALRELGYCLYLIPLTGLFQALYQVLYFWFNRQQNYALMARYRILISVMTIAIAIVLGWYPIVADGLILSQLIAYGIAVIDMGRKTRKDILGKKIRIKWDTLMSQAKRYVNFPRYLIFAHGMESISIQLPVILLGQFFGAAVVGYFTLTQRVIAAPLSFIAKTAGDIIRERFSASYRQYGNCRKDYGVTIKVLAVVAFPVLLLFSIFGPALFTLVFGEHWVKSGQYAQALALMIFAQIIASPISVLYMIAEKQKKELLLQVARISICYAALAGGYYYYASDIAAILLYGGSMCLIYAFMIYQTKKWACATPRD